MESGKEIFVYADFEQFDNELVGKINVSNVRGREFYSFEYSEEWLKHQNFVIDPDLQLYKGRQYINDDKKIFGAFADSCPDRWGRKLMDRREELRARENDERPRKLLESDYLLGVYDKSRMGGLRFKTNEDGPFLSDDVEFSTPLWTSLRELEQASIAFENEDNGIEKKDAEKMVDEIKDIVTNNWKNLASKYGVGRGEIERMKVAFV